MSTGTSASKTVVTHAMPTSLSGLVSSVVSYVFTMMLQIFKSVTSSTANPKED